MSRSRKSSSSFRGSLNDRMVWIVAFLLLLAPALFGSNRPIFWLLWAVYLSLTGVWWFVRMGSSEDQLRIPLGSQNAVLVLFATLAVYMIVQAVPIGSLAPDFYSITDPQNPITNSSISLTPGDTVLALVRWLTYGLLFFLVLQLSANRSRAYRLITTAYWIIVIHAVLGILFRFQFGDTILGVIKNSYIGSATGGFVNRNSYATFLAFGAILGLALILEKTLFPAKATDPKASRLDAYTSRGGVVHIGVGWLMIIVALMASNSRMGFGATVSGLIFISALAYFKAPKQSSRRPVWFIVLGMVAITGALTLLHGQTLVERLGNSEGDSDIRIQLYAQVLKMIAQRPLLGFGGNSFEHAYPLFHELPVNLDRLWDKAHNTYLANWTEYGLIFGSLPILIVAILGLKLLRSFIAREGCDVLVLAALGVLLAGGVHSLVDFSLEIEADVFVFVTIIAAGVARAFMRDRVGGDGQ